MDNKGICGALDQPSATLSSKRAKCAACDTYSGNWQGKTASIYN